VLISNSHRFIFVHIPKTAGMSLRHVLTPFTNGSERKGFRRFLSNLPVPESPEKVAFPLHVTARWARTKLPPQVFDGYLKFAVSRNPYDRAVSYVEFLKQTPHLKRYEQYRDASFTEALEMMGQRRRSETQLDMVADAEGRMLIDRVLRMETLDEDFEALCKDLGLPPLQLPKHNTTQRGHYTDHFATPQAREQVEALFGADFDAFGYSRDPAVQYATAPAKVAHNGSRANQTHVKATA
jgi:hypothetical protein